MHLKRQGYYKGINLKKKGLFDRLGLLPYGLYCGLSSAVGSAPFPFKDRLWHDEPIFVRLDTAQLAVDELLYGGKVECVLLISEAD